MQPKSEADGDRWKELESLFERLADASPGERSLVFATELGGRLRLRRRLEAMLAAHDIGSIEVSRAVEAAFRGYYQDPPPGAGTTRDA